VTGMSGRLRRAGPIGFVILVAGWWVVALMSPREPAAPAPSAAGQASFQPVPDTSPVPNYYFTRAAAPQVRPAAGLEAATSHTEFFVFYSRSLDRPMHYLVYEPAGYIENTNRRYPVLYMLHGVGAGLGGPSGFETEWPGYGLLAAADKLIAQGTLQPLLIVLPEGDQSYWIDHANNGPRYGAYTTVDLVQEIDARFRTLPDRQHRAIGGLSMGGFGALSLGLSSPEVFGAAGAHSASFPKLDDKAPSFFGDADYFALHDPCALLAGHPDAASRLKLWLDVAADDPLWKAGSEAFHEQLEESGVSHEWHIWPGAHDGLYWGAHMEDYLRFYGGAFES
jgi:enterochelin esterase-like enzyme